MKLYYRSERNHKLRYDDARLHRSDRYGQTYWRVSRDGQWIATFVETGDLNDFLAKKRNEGA